MNENSIFFAVDKIEDKFIEEAAESAMEENSVQPIFITPTQKKTKKPIFAIASIAACFALIFGVGIAVSRNSGMEITQPPLNIEETTTAAVIITPAEVTTTAAAATPAETTPAETEPQGIKMTDEQGNEFTILGEPISQEKLSDFYYEEKYRLYLENYKNNVEFQKLLNSIPERDRAEIEEAYLRAIVLANAVVGYNNLSWTQEEINDKAKLNLNIKSDNGNYDMTFIETGASYDSFLKAYYNIFSEDTVNYLLFSSESMNIWCPLSYNNELWVRELIGMGGNPSIVFSEFELVKAAEDEIEFNEIYYYTEDCSFPYYPWLKDLYSSFKVKNRFVRTENGWRVEELAFSGGYSTSGMGYEHNAVFDRIEKDEVLIYNALKEIYLNNSTLSPLKSPWTEEKVTEAWEQIKEPHNYEGDLVIEESYTDRYFCDLDGDNISELVMVSNLDSEINIFGINSSGNVTLKGKSEYDDHCRYINTTFVADVAVLKEDLKHYYQYTEEFLTDREFGIFTDSSGKFYITVHDWVGDSEVWCQIMELNLIGLKAYKKFDVVPLYEWSFDYDWNNPEVNNTMIYKKYQPAENSSALISTEVTKDEVINFIDTLKPAE